MKVLALTSSTHRASIALGEDGRLFERTHSVPRGHTEFMNSALQELLDESGWKLTDLDVIAIDQGPGSFTGIRVAVSVARSLCYLLKKPCFVTTSLDVLAEQEARPLLIGINAYKNLIFSSLIQSSSERMGPKVLSPSDLEDWVHRHLGLQAPLTFVGDAWEIYRSDFSADFQKRILRSKELSDYPKAEALARLAWKSSPSTWIQDWKLITPLYLRESAAEENLRRPL